MEKETARSIKVGLFIITGAIFLIAAIYLIGSRRNLFGSNIYISALFQDVNGLQKGNNVRFAGINVGTVDDILILDDSSIVVVMSIEKEVQRFIKKDAVAAIGSNGLMGNRLVNISIGTTDAMAVRDGDRIRSIQPFQVDEMLRVLGSTNQKINDITGDVKEITEALSTGKGAMWKLLSDTATSRKLDRLMDNLEHTSAEAARMGSDLSSITSGIRQGKGSMGKLITDTMLGHKLDNSLTDLEAVLKETKEFAGHLTEVSKKLAQEEGALGVLTSDTSALKLKRTLDNIEQGTKSFSENMEALKENFLFRRYFRKKKEKEKD